MPFATGTAPRFDLAGETAGEILGAFGRVLDRLDGHQAVGLGIEKNGLLNVTVTTKARAAKTRQASRTLDHWGYRDGPGLDLIGAGAAQEQAVVGETPNLAARLQTLAEPDAVVIAQSTHRLTSGLFEYENLGAVEAKGYAVPVQAWRVLREGTAESRFEAMHGGAVATPFIGREDDIDLLLRQWRQAKEEGEGRVVLLSGEAGIGKSRITRTIRERLTGEAHTRLLYFCSPHHQASAFHPFIRQLERAAGFERDDTADLKIEKLEALLKLSSRDVARDTALVAELLSIPRGGSRYPAGPDLSPQKRKEETLTTLLEQLVGLAARQPVLMIIEDAHWIDPSSLELLERSIDRVLRLPVLLIVTARPEFAPPWTGRPHVTVHPLNRLSRREGLSMINQVAGGKALPREVVDQIIARTDGVPLFVEELTKAILESDALRSEGERYVLTAPLPSLAIPTTLHASLMARLDRLAPVKEVAQIGAVIGREFSYELLTAVAGWPDDRLQDALAQLTSAELIFRHGTLPHATYSFKHALVQDAAYQSLLKSKRRQLHARIAQVLEKGSTDAGETGPEVLAWHLTEAGLVERAIPYWGRAGKLAAGRSANLEAIAHLRKGLDLIEKLPNASNHLDEELDLLMAIGGPLMTTKGYAAQDVEHTYSRASALCDQLGRATELFSALRGLWNCYLVRGEFQRAHDLAERLVALADEQGMPLRRALARRAHGTTLFFFGRFADALAALEEGITIDDAVAAWDEHRADLLLDTERAAVACRLYSAEALWFLGFPDQARERIESGIALAERLAHLNSLAFALTWAAMLYNLRREFAVAQRRAEAAIEIAGKYRMSAWFGHASVCRGYALTRLGCESEGRAQIQAGLATWNVTGGHLLDTQWLGFLAEAHLQAGQFDEALNALNRATETTVATGECHYQAELYRLRGVLLAEVGDAGEATSWLQRALDKARSQRAKSLELRAATSLTPLWRQQGRCAEAHNLLARVYGWFTEGLGTADLREAKALLDEASA